jgi:hypothetical protein
MPVYFMCKTLALPYSKSECLKFVSHVKQHLVGFNLISGNYWLIHLAAQVFCYLKPADLVLNVISKHRLRTMEQED